MTDPTNPLAPTAPAQAGQVNWGDLMSQATGSEPLPDGPYNVQVSEASVGQTQTGKTMFKVTFTVLDGPHINRKLWTNLTVSPESPQALGIFFSQMSALGLTKEYFATGPTPDAIVSNLLGKQATVTTTTREWGGSLRNDVKNIRPMKQQIAHPGSVAPSAPAPGAPASGPAAPPKLPF